MQYLIHFVIRYVNRWYICNDNFSFYTTKTIHCTKTYRCQIYRNTNAIEFIRKLKIDNQWLIIISLQFKSSKINERGRGWCIVSTSYEQFVFFQESFLHHCVPVSSFKRLNQTDILHCYTYYTYQGKIQLPKTHGVDVRQSYYTSNITTQEGKRYL